MLKDTLDKYFGILNEFDDLEKEKRKLSRKLTKFEKEMQTDLINAFPEEIKLPMTEDIIKRRSEVPAFITETDDRFAVQMDYLDKAGYTYKVILAKDMKTFLLRANTPINKHDVICILAVEEEC